MAAVLRATLLALIVCAAHVSSAAEEECDAPAVNLMQTGVQIKHNILAEGEAAAAAVAPAFAQGVPGRWIQDQDADAWAKRERYGSDDCQCIGVDKLEGHVKALVSGNITDGKYVDYPADLGARCEAWDKDTNPSCPGKDWCEQKWCYVDPCKCKNPYKWFSPPKPSTYLPTALYQATILHYSYSTCGGTDTYTAADNKKTWDDLGTTCSVVRQTGVLSKGDSVYWGAEKCRCVGLAGKDGVAKVTMSGKLVDAAADTGAYCKKWEEKYDPACKGDQKPEYCDQSWCFVDPCSCKITDSGGGTGDFPMISRQVPTSKNQGHAVYYSYRTCGKEQRDTGKELASVCLPNLNAPTGHWKSKVSSQAAPKVFVAIGLALACFY